MTYFRVSLIILIFATSVRSTFRIKGDKGDPGFSIIGNPGPPGYNGLPGLKGPAGPKGDQGLPGLNGLHGTPGMKGDEGRPGDAGLPGLKGPAGPKGDQGLPGLNGLHGTPGMKGDEGRPGHAGLSGLQGPAGPKGDQGMIGFQGPPGLPGPQRSPGILLVKHSQLATVPICEPGHVKLWDGYSLLSLEVNEKAYNLNLGSTGSCIRYFSTMPFLFCDINNVCTGDYAKRYRSYWLSTNMITMMPLKGPEIQSYISRCVVCEAPSNVITLHSQTQTVPECPNGWESSWIGYSFAMHTGAGDEGGGQDLASSGSCLQDFRATPFIECTQGGSCNHYSGSLSFWLTTIDPEEQFEPTKRLKLSYSYNDQKSKISRCIVCTRKN